MKFLKNCVVFLLALQLGFGPILAQPILNQQNLFQIPIGSGITNLRITSQTADGTEALLTMDYSYDGFAGPTALVVPSIEKKGQKGVSVWFGSDPVTIGEGRGVISIKVKYFNDEPGVPPMFTSDRISILILNRQASAILSRIPFLKNIKWGSPNAKPVSAAPGGPSVSNQPNAVRLAEQMRRAEEQAGAEVKNREQARLKAEAQASMRREAEAKAIADTKSREQARLKAEAEAARLAQEERLAEQTRIADEQFREEARLKAEAEANRLSEERRVAEERATAQARARAEAQLKARAEEKTRIEAEAKTIAEARAREEARLKAEAEARRLADEQRAAEQQSVAQEKAREEARLKAQAEADRLAREKALAEIQAAAAAQARQEARVKARAEEEARVAAGQKALAEARTREQARLKAETEAKRLAEEKRLAQEKALAESEAREQARLKAQADAKRLSEETRAAEEKVKFEAAARQLAEQLARQEADAARLAAEKAQIQKLASARSSESPSVPSIEMAQGLKSKVTNVEIVQRSTDRSQMTIGVEYEYKNDFASKALLGVDVLRLAEPQVASYFHSPAMEIGKSRRNFMLFPVKFQPPSSVANDGAGFSTDKVLVYLVEAATGKRFNLFPAAVLLMWHAPGAMAAAIAQANGNSIEFDNFQQNDPSSGYVTVKYNSPAGTAKLSVRIFDDSNPKSADWFNTQTLEVKQGRGVQVLDVRVEPESTSPTAIFKANTIEIVLVDSNGKAAAKVARQTSMTWAKPK